MRFNADSYGAKARNQSAEGSRVYIRETAPGRSTNRTPLFLKVAHNNRTTEKYWPLLTPKFEIGCKVSSFPYCQDVHYHITSLCEHSGGCLITANISLACSEATFI